MSDNQHWQAFCRIGVDDCVFLKRNNYPVRQAVKIA
jgi:hypothetical protein